ncbi:hypothetical protein J538_1192 [Acinetobacter sp. 272263]|nr:hypothetical protein J538_1192 [Acinetobacter sp. 272263]
MVISFSPLGVNTHLALAPISTPNAFFAENGAVTVMLPFEAL